MVSRELIFILTLCACAPDLVVSDAGIMETVDAGPVDAGHKADGCAAQFGAAFTNDFGRADGTVVAVVPPAWQCPLPNSDHAVIQLMIHGQVQRLVVNVQSSFGDPRIRFRTLETPLPSPPWEEGWHPALSIDYAAFGVHSDAGWEALPMEDVAARIYDAILVGAPLSVYGTSSGDSYADSAHKIHRNGKQDDGAIVIDPQSPSPKWLLFHFENQSF